MFASHYRRIVRASAFYDLLVTAPFATPWTFAWVSAFFEFAWWVVQGYGYWLLRKVESQAPSGCRVVNYFRVVGV